MVTPTLAERMPSPCEQPHTNPPVPPGSPSPIPTRQAPPPPPQAPITPEQPDTHPLPRPISNHPTERPMTTQLIQILGLTLGAAALFGALAYWTTRRQAARHAALRALATQWLKIPHIFSIDNQYDTSGLPQPSW